MLTVEPSRERVEAYEKALGCRFIPGCLPHHFSSEECDDAGGCPVAVAAARVEAERVAELENELELAHDDTSSETQRADEAEVEVDRLTRLISHIKIDN